VGARIVDRPCGYCGGTGIIYEGDFVESEATCPICKRHGIVRVPSNYRKCPDCGGAGKKDVGEFVPDVRRCKRCKGTGWAEPPPEYR